jgi:hypothetical protein
METTAELNRRSKAIMAPHHMDINAQEASLLIHGWLEKQMPLVFLVTDSEGITYRHLSSIKSAKGLEFELMASTGSVIIDISDPTLRFGYGEVRDLPTQLAAKLSSEQQPASYLLVSFPQPSLSKPQSIALIELPPSVLSTNRECWLT